MNIEKEELVRRLKIAEPYNNQDVPQYIWSIINAIPSAERKGHWIEEHEPFTWMGYTKWHCSCCGFKCGYEQRIDFPTKFCPDCGADMRGEKA